METIANLIEDRDSLPAPAVAEPDALLELLDERGIHFTTWDGWLTLDAHERTLGETDAFVRERVKVVPRDEQVSISRDGAFALS